jgi:hypothetical protein
MVSPFVNVDHPENYIGIGRNLTQQPIWTHSTISISGGIPDARTNRVNNRSGVGEANRPRRAHVMHVNRDRINVHAEFLHYRSTPVVACIEHHNDLRRHRHKHHRSEHRPQAPLQQRSLIVCRHNHHGAIHCALGFYHDARIAAFEQSHTCASNQARCPNLAKFGRQRALHTLLTVSQAAWP